MEQEQARLRAIGQPLDLHLAGPRVLQASRHDAQRVAAVLAKELPFAPGLAIGQAAQGEDAVDVLHVVGGTGLVLDHLPDGVPSALVPAHGGAAPLDALALRDLPVPDGLLVEDVLHQRLEHEMSARLLDLLLEIGVTDGCDLLVYRHAGSSKAQSR